MTRPLVLALILWTAGGCGGQERVCDPGRQVECACPNGSTGAQACREDGSGYEPCQCTAPVTEIEVMEPQPAHEELAPVHIRTREGGESEATAADLEATTVESEANEEEGEPAPDVEPEAAQAGGDPIARCRDVMAEGGEFNRCIITRLEGREGNARQSQMLIQSYRAIGNMPLALRHMCQYVQRFPDTSAARNYLQILQAHGHSC